jgi:predicted pyridoxine 5'-phosphate oxidase superfamily flavin-nucleotide-binding protein
MTDATRERPKIDRVVRSDIENSVLCWLATVDRNGVPNVTPKEIFSCHGDDHIVVADIASGNTVRNIRAHPAVCVSFVDIFRQQGFKISGSATIMAPEDADFATIGAELLRMAGSVFPVRHVISIRVERISRIWAPSYMLMPDLTVEDRMRQAYSTYGVVPSA